MKELLLNEIKNIANENESNSYYGIVFDDIKNKLFFNGYDVKDYFDSKTIDKLLPLKNKNWGEWIEDDLKSSSIEDVLLLEVNGEIFCLKFHQKCYNNGLYTIPTIEVKHISDFNEKVFSYKNVDFYSNGKTNYKTFNQFLYLIENDKDNIEKIINELYMIPNE